MIKNIIEHLTTKKKYNTLMVKYEAILDELQQKNIELSLQKSINKMEKEKFEKEVENFLKTIISLKEKNIKKEKKSKNDDGRKNTKVH